LSARIVSCNCSELLLHFIFDFFVIPSRNYFNPRAISGSICIRNTHYRYCSTNSSPLRPAVIWFRRYKTCPKRVRWCRNVLPTFRRKVRYWFTAHERSESDEFILFTFWNLRNRRNITAISGNLFLSSVNQC